MDADELMNPQFTLDGAGKKSPGSHGLMDLAVGAKRVVPAEHKTKDQKPKIQVNWAAIDGIRHVKRIITEMAVSTLPRRIACEIAPGLGG
jgi:acyl CoA:acetate/3-ketoacid CoA transferase beta subunit